MTAPDETKETPKVMAKINVELGGELFLVGEDTLRVANETQEEQWLGNSSFSLRIQPGKAFLVLPEEGYKSMLKDANSMRNLRSWGSKERMKWARWPKRFAKYENERKPEESEWED